MMTDNGHDLEREVHAIRVRAERRAGELLREVPKAKAAPGNQYTGPVVPDDRSKSQPKTLAEHGITKDQSALWQKHAEVLEGEFEAEVANPVAMPTAANIVAPHESRKAGPAEPKSPLTPKHSGCPQRHDKRPRRGYH